MNDNGVSPVIGVLLMAGIVLLIAVCISVIIFDVVKPQYESTPTDAFRHNTITDSFHQGIADGMNETYLPDKYWNNRDSYRDGYKTGLTIKYCNCMGGVP